jgi:hypothetical protein
MQNLTLTSRVQVYWLIVPAIWGTITLIRARSVVHTQDSKWTYGQILPVLILVGVIGVAIGSFLQRDTSTPLPISEEPQRYTDNPPTASTSGQETTPLLQQEARPLFERDFSNPDTTPWISPAIALPCIHVALFTAFFFRYLYDLQPNAASLLVRYIVPVLIGIPASSYTFILLSLGYEKLIAPGQKSSGPYWGLMASVWAVTGGLYSLFLYRQSWAVPLVLDFVVLGVEAVIVLLNVFALVAAKKGRTGVISI